MVILDKNHIEQAYSVVHTTTDAYSLFLHDTHTRSGFASVENTSVCTLELTHIFTCHCSDTAHALHHIEHKTLSLQQRPYTTRHIHGNITLFNLSTILNKHFNLQILVETGKDTLCHLNAGKYTILLDKEHILSHSISRNCRKGCMVAVTNILSKG